MGYQPFPCCFPGPRPDAALSRRLPSSAALAAARLNGATRVRFSYGLPTFPLLFSWAASRRSPLKTASFKRGFGRGAPQRRDTSSILVWATNLFTAFVLGRVPTQPSQGGFLSNAASPRRALPARHEFDSRMGYQLFTGLFLGPRPDAPLSRRLPSSAASPRRALPTRHEFDSRMGYQLFTGLFLGPRPDAPLSRRLPPGQAEEILFCVPRPAGAP